ncbi:MAG: bacillithiol system redox-active protein YtxJ [Flavitalea sp.]
MDWKVLNEDQQVKDIIEKSKYRPQVIFKHSTRCSISSVAKNRLDKANAPTDIDFYYLDLIRFRSLSQQISERFKVHHESPQILIIRDGECVYEESHMGITMQDILLNTSF